MASLHDVYNYCVYLVTHQLNQQVTIDSGYHSNWFNVKWNPLESIVVTIIPNGYSISYYNLSYKIIVSKDVNTIQDLYDMITDIINKSRPFRVF